MRTRITTYGVLDGGAEQPDHALGHRCRDALRARAADRRRPNVAR